MSSVLGELGRIGIIPVIRIDSAERAVPLARALIAGDLPCIEVTFRSSVAEQALADIAREVPEMLVGAGTVLTVEQAERAVTAGAEYIVSPGFDPAVVDWCLQHGVPITPGVATPTEINMALTKGLDILKFFPAEELGGAKMLKAFGGPYGNVSFIPTGGINAQNLRDYLVLPNVYACGGSWLATSKMIADGEFDRITDLAREARAIARQSRGLGE